MYIVHQKQQPHLWIAAYSSLVMEYFMNINYLHYAEASSGMHTLKTFSVATLYHLCSALVISQVNFR